MERTRLGRIRSKRAARQGLWYLVIAGGLILVMLIWGLSGLARIAGYLTSPDTSPEVSYDLRPTPPIFSDVPEATYSAKVKVAGFAQPGVDVVLYLNDAMHSRKLTSDSGTFLFEEIALEDGENTVYARSVSVQNLESEQSKSYKITLDTSKPSITLDSPKDGDSFSGQSARIVTFSGGVNEDGRVYVGDRLAILQSDGKFSLSYQLIEGEQEIPIKASDKAGNESVMMVKLRWEP